MATVVCVDTPVEKAGFAPTDAVDALAPYVRRVLDALNVTSVLFVSDESSIGDFTTDEAELVSIREKLRVPVDHSDLVIDVARRLRALGSG